LSGNAIQDFSSLQQYWTKFICKTEKEKHAKKQIHIKMRWLCNQTKVFNAKSARIQAIELIN
jgi:hypothetical protein